MVRSIRADSVIDYSHEVFTQSGERYDLILDMVGNRPMSEIRRILNPEGIYVSVGVAQMGNWIGPLTGVLKVLAASLIGSQKMVPMLAKQTNEDLVVLRELLEAGEMTPVIDRQYELSDVPQAIRYLEEGHAQGKVVITV